MPLNNNLDNSNSDYSFKSMPRPQKVAVISLSFAGVAIIFFAALQFKTRVNSPFQHDFEDITKVSSLDLMNLDTDKDGLSDYDEEINQTSRYLPDTDSDGIPDKDEVENGSDPICPNGQDCSSLEELIIKDTSTSTNSVSPEGLGSINIDSEANEAELRSALSGEVDIPTLRRLLIEGGASEETLNQISDEDLLKSYQEVLNKQNE